MDVKGRFAAIDACENILREDFKYNEAHGIWRSINRIIEGLLGRSTELADVYVELHAALAEQPRALNSFFDVFTTTVYSWNPGKIKEAREDREKLTELNERIAKVSELLSELLSRRTEVKEMSSFSSDTYYHIMDVVEEASEDNGLFRFHVKGKLERLTCQYDLKYWPSITKVVAQIGVNAASAVIVADDSAASAATEARRPGLADFLKAFEAELDRNRVENIGFIPDDFSLTDSSMASLVNCGLGLGVEELIGASFVKRYRQRERDRDRG
ncbi:hypothetical protein GHO40_24290 [Pseudomonas helleri]|uniref:Uncharacterized protein n=1 Tax=Pseudomonas helleri TaxID=1608996 RepID=A0A7X2BKS5_9PSED|nr:hypothetical protein [Pseudomonas helleri]MQT49815.1 hypothetical protein [Pseudomonas helleri]MQT92594.1 hypothetical protein [Pseudomonas helleri]